LAAMVRRRCTECRKRFAPVVSACGHQRVCGAVCRGRRRNRLARRRRGDDLDGQRAKECTRQRKRRKGPEGVGCHELASDANSLDLLRKVGEIVDRAASLSRASLRRDLRRILGKFRPRGPAEVERVGTCHELASAMGAGKNGSRSGLDVDAVTGRSGGR